MNCLNGKAWQSHCTGIVSLLVLCLCAQPGVAQTEQILCDDFSYTTTTQLANNGWRLRTWEGGPGLMNGTWSTNNVSFVSDTLIFRYSYFTFGLFPPRTLQARFSIFILLSSHS